MIAMFNNDLVVNCSIPKIITYLFFNLLLTPLIHFMENPCFEVCINAVPKIPVAEMTINLIIGN